MLIIKDADIDDLLDIFAWRNDPISRKMSISNEKLILEDHKKWFESSLINPSIKIYIGIMKGEKIGICRFDVDQKIASADVSINLNPNMRGKNLSYSLLSDSIKAYKKTKQIKLMATIKKENKASLRIFQECSFSIVDEDIGYYYLKQI